MTRAAVNIRLPGARPNRRKRPVTCDRSYARYIGRHGAAKVLDDSLHLLAWTKHELAGECEAARRIIDRGRRVIEWDRTAALAEIEANAGKGLDRTADAEEAYVAIASATQPSGDCASP